MTLNVWKPTHCPTYVVQVGDAVYEMDDNANMPNGVCIYLGGPEARPERDITYLVDDVPVAIVRQILNILESDNE